MGQTRIIVIGFTGPSGSGKTTLAKWLAQQKIGRGKVKIHYFEGSASLTHTEEQRAILKEKYNYEPKGHQNVINLSSQNPEFGYDFQYFLAQGRAKRLDEFVNGLDDDGSIHLVITDRTFIDILAYSSLQCAHNIDDSRMVELAKLCEISQGQFFDLTFVVKPNDGWTEDNGSRVPRNFYQNRVVWPVIESSVDKYQKAGGTGVFKSLSMWDLQERKNRVMDNIYYAIYGKYPSHTPQAETENVENK